MFDGIAPETVRPEGVGPEGVGPAKIRLCLIGNGMAGARAVEEIINRENADGYSGPRFDITVIGDEPHGNYNRIMLSHVLAGETELDDEDFLLNPEHWYASNGITLLIGTRASHIDKFTKTVTASPTQGDGPDLEVAYDILLIATGSVSFFPPMDGVRGDDGAVLPGIYGFRSIADTVGMLDVVSARPGAKATVIGGGLLGLEAAHGLAERGMTVSVVHSPAHLMNQQLDARGGRVLRQKIESLGIEVLTGKRTTAVIRDDAGAITGVGFKDGDSVDTSMVIIAAGIRPNVELARHSGLSVERGIVVDDTMRCEDEASIYAIGECVQHRGEVYGLVAPLWEQAVVLADRLTETNPDAEYHGSRLTTKLKVAGVDVAQMGIQGPEREDDEFVQYYEPTKGTYKSVVVRDGKLVGAMLLGDVGKVGFLSQAFDDKVALPDEKIEMLFDLGTPNAESGAADMADDAQVCNCNGVSKGAIVACVHAGASSIADVVAQTRAGKGCGACKGLVGDIVACALGGELTADPSENWYVPCIPLAKPELIAEIRSQELKSVSAVFAALADDGVEHTPSKMPLASLLRVVWGSQWIDERGALYINDRVHANIQKDGTFSVVPQMKGGVTTPDQLRTIAEVADKYQVPMVKVTGGQRIDLLGIKKEDLPKVWADLDMPSGFAYGKSFRTVKTCVGLDFCRFGLDDSTALGIALEARFQGFESPAKLKLAVTGCPRNCAEALCKDFGVQAIGDGKWEIYVGGAAGAHIRKGDVLATVNSAEEVVRLCGIFIQYYREDAKWLERTYAWVPRRSIETLREILVDDSLGIVAQLQERVDLAVADYADPWKQRDAPRSPAQFRSSLPLTVLPTVGARA